MPRLSDEERTQAKCMLRNCTINNTACNIFQYSTSRKLIRLLQRSVAQIGTIKDRPCGGRLPKTTDADNRQMRLAHLRNRFKSSSASETARTFRISISRQTAMMRLRAYGLKYRNPVRSHFWQIDTGKQVLTGHRNTGDGFYLCGRY